MSDPFTTDRLVLRRFTTDDADDLVALDRDPAVRRYIEDGVVPTREDALDTIEHWTATDDHHELFGFWAAIDRSTGAFLGWFHLRSRDDDPPDEPELGYRLVPSCWGQGYATEGSRALIDRAFASGAARRIVAETMAVNVGSRRVMEKSGLRLVRTFHAEWPVRIDGDEHGDVEYAITRSEWDEQRGQAPT
ncbi:MAG: GNAT family N-acetyltransferase [Actinobacteria bacterium]|nr:GNAT family N-acetyltransferase [Actinomycetota bacterium]